MALRNRAPATPLDELRDAIARLASRIADDSVGGRLLPDGALEELARAFDLSALDLDLLVVAAAPDLDERLASLLDGRVTIGRARALVGAAPWDAGARERLGPAGPLVHHALVHVDD